MSTTAPGLALGLDIGGSSVKSALLACQPGARPTLVDSDLWPLASREPAFVLDDLEAITARYREQYGPVESIGLGIPGIFDEASGESRLLPNFPATWNGYPLRSDAEERLGQRVILANDAKAFSVAESVLGAAAGHSLVACVVLGTGVGGGVVLDGSVWQGQGTAGELGHLTVQLDGPPCGCGNNGCVEAFAGSAAISANGGQPTAADVFSAASGGNPRAQSAVRLAIEALAAGMANVFITLAPDVFVIGGGVAGAGDQLLKPLQSAVQRRVRVAPAEQIRVRPATLGRHAGAIGAALLGSQR